MTNGSKQPSAEPVLLRSRARGRERWANGQGFTSPVAIDSGAEPHWRINIADIPGDCDFSVLPGVDRIFLLLTDRPLILDLNPTVTVEPLRPISFAGESAPRCRSEGPATALNVLSRRGSAPAQMKVLEIDGSAIISVPAAPAIESLETSTTTTTVAVVADGRITGPGGEDLDVGDAVMVAASNRPFGLSITGTGHIAVIRVETVVVRTAVAETAVVEAVLVETPAFQTPAVETPVVETSVAVGKFEEVESPGNPGDTHDTHDTDDTVTG